MDPRSSRQSKTALEKIVKADVEKNRSQYIKQLSSASLRIVKATWASYVGARASQAAAALAYYTIFSLFPLLIVMIAGGSFFLDSPMFYRDLTRIIQRAIPVSSQLIIENLNQVMEARGTVGIISLLTLLWSASGLFSSLARNISLAWPGSSRRNFLKNRLIGIGMVIGLSALFILSFTLFRVIDFPSLVEEKNSPLTQNFWWFLASLGSWLVIFFFFLALYHWIPTWNVRSKSSFWGALFGSVGWEIAIWGFTWFLKSGLGSYKLIYGSLGAIMALLFLIYILSNIILLGAHLSATIDHWAETGTKRNIER